MDAEPTWPDDFTPSEAPSWPADWSRERIEREAADMVARYVEDWGWEVHRYARLNDAARVRKTLRYELRLEASRARGAQREVLDWQDADFGQCALWWLAMHGNAELAALLIEAGCDVDLADRDGWTPLSVAAYYGHTEVVRALLAAGADAAREVDDGDSAYDKAVANARHDCASLLKGA